MVRPPFPRPFRISAHFRISGERAPPHELRAVALELDARGLDQTVQGDFALEALELGVGMRAISTS
ncbi:MAG: hypothetical protein ACR2RB_01510 [Gammaproteobacteria bacterium]